MTHVPNAIPALGERYTIERELGYGGMATVYLAADTKHGRKVAIKVLRPELAASVGPDRFLREIETVARLSHPHILPLYDSGATDACLYYVMPYVRGETLRQRLARDVQLPVHEAVTITRHVASALDFAHSHGVLHRDIKPENILIHEGEAMLADFGIALAVGGEASGRLTALGMAIGTPEYMSPEQAVGDTVLDTRSDVFSLGCVLYEMLAGEPPHTGASPLAVIASRITVPARRVRHRRSGVSAAVDDALAKALAIDPADRFASAGAFAAALRTDDATRSDQPTIAVLPFLNLSSVAENEYFADGLTEDVIAQLSKIQALKVISRTSAMRFKRREQSLNEIAAALGATAVLDGSVRRAADRVRIVAQLIDVAADRTLWTETYDRQLTDIFAIQSDVALQIARALRAELSPDERVRIAHEPTADLEAYHLYLRGRHQFTRFSGEGFKKGIEYYRAAVTRDPRYAMAYVGLALGYAELAETGADNPDEAYARGKEAARKALELDPDLGDAHTVLAYLKFASDFDWIGAEEEFHRALELTPGSADAYDLYGRLCAAMGRFDEAVALLARAQALDPMAHRIDIATALLRAGRYDEALENAQLALELDPKYARAHATVAWTFAKRGRLDEARTHMEKAVALGSDDTMWIAQHGQICAMAGDRDTARATLRRLEELSSQRYVSPYHIAYVFTGLGELDRAMDYLERAFANRSGAVYGIKGSFLFTPLHSHPRFQALLRRMNLA